MKQKIAIISGVNGQDGSYLSEHLLSLGYLVIGLKRRTSTITTERIDNIYNNPAVSFKSIKQPLRSDEAFELAIKRALESGAPVNNMEFYEEVNWSLAQLGFPAKSPLDIKNKIVSMISNKDRN